ncbi:MAG: hypothetical protein HYV32_00655 [Candidatus Kerfeldbacteria bacterium]|nr:hypothetical protein [Candidatus Kerfeldbacteria bacterium]
MTNIERRSTLTPERAELLEMFHDAKKMIESMTGLQLTTIEGVGLRRITEECWNQYQRYVAQGVHSDNLFSMTEEVPARFFVEFYGLTDAELSFLFPSNIPTPESTKQYFKKLQAENHLL